MTRCHFDVNISHWFNCLVLPLLLYRAIKTRMSLISTKCSQKILHIPHILIMLTVINQSTPVYLVPCVRPSLPRLPPCTSSIVLQLWTLGWHANLQPTYFLNIYHLFCAKCLPPVRSVTHQRCGDACNQPIAGIIVLKLHHVIYTWWSQVGLIFTWPIWQMFVCTIAKIFYT